MSLRSRELLLALAIVISLACGSRAVRADEAPYSWTPWNPCPGCDLLVGVGTTFRFFAWTDGIVLPVTLEIDDSRWEVGAFRFATPQYLEEEPEFAASVRSANPQWAFDGLRRWQILRRPWGKLYLGFGGSYKMENDLLDSRWNFAYLAAIRHPLPGGSILELSVRHWSNAWFRAPNRGITFVMLGVGL